MLVAFLSSLILVFLAEADRLLQVQILIRHSERAPVHEFTTAESAQLFPRGLGEVTTEGLLRATEQGAAFRQRYVQLGPLSENTDVSEIFIRSSPIKRALQFASAFAMSITGEGMPSIRTTDSLEDETVLIVHDSIEHRCKVLARHNVSDPPFCRLTPLLAKFVKEYPDCADFSYAKIEAALAVVDNPVIRLDSALERCARGDALRIQFRSLSIRPGVGDEFDAVRLRAVIGPLMAIVSRNVDDVVRTNSTTTPVRIYYSHDHVILAAAQALGIIDAYEETSPSLSSAIAIETWTTNDGVQIRVVMKNGVRSPFQSVASHKLQEFKNLIQPYTTTNHDSVQWDDQLTKIYTIADFDKEAGTVHSNVSLILTRHRLEERTTLPFQILFIALLLLAVICAFVLRRNNGECIDSYSYDEIDSTSAVMIKEELC